MFCGPHILAHFGRKPATSVLAVPYSTAPFRCSVFIPNCIQTERPKPVVYWAHFVQYVYERQMPYKSMASLRFAPTKPYLGVF